MAPFARTVPASFTHSWASSSSSSPYATSSSAAHANLLGGYITRSPPTLSQHTELPVRPSISGGGPVWGNNPTGYYPRRQRPLPRNPRIRLNFDPFADSPAEPILPPLHQSQGPIIFQSSRLPVSTVSLINHSDQYTRPQSSSTGPVAQPLSLRIQTSPTHLLPPQTQPPLSRVQTRYQSGSGSLGLDPTPPPSNVGFAADRNARSRLVAGILLNRVHAVGRPMRAARYRTGPKEYVKSGLSRVVCVEA